MLIKIQEAMEDSLVVVKEITPRPPVPAPLVEIELIIFCLLGAKILHVTLQQPLIKQLHNNNNNIDSTSGIFVCAIASL